MQDYSTDLKDKGLNLTEETNTVDHLSRELAIWRRDSFLARSLLKKTQGMQNAGEAFLPQHTLEKKAKYEARLEGSVLLEAYAKTCNLLSGLAFQNKLIFDENLPESVIEWNKDIDLKGNEVNVFLKRQFFTGLGKGVSYTLVDMPKMNNDGEELTVLQAEKQGIRPYFRDIPAMSVLGGLVDDNGTLIQFRFLEKYTERVGKFGSKTRNSVVVLNGDGTWERHKASSAEEYEIVESGKLSVDYIPLIIFIPGEENRNGTGMLTGNPPMQGLCDLNLAHWKSRSVQTAYLATARIPIYFSRYVDLAKIINDASTIINTNKDNSDLKVVEMSGKSIESGAKDLQGLEEQLALYGLQQLVPDTVQKTATEKSLSSAEANSSLQSWMVDFTAMAKKMYQILFEMSGNLVGGKYDEDETINLNLEIDSGLFKEKEVQTILKLHDQGILSSHKAFEEIKRRGGIDSELEWEENQDELEADSFNLDFSFGGNAVEDQR